MIGFSALKHPGLIVMFILSLKTWNAVSQCTDFRFIDIKGHGGSHLYTGDDLSDVLDNGYGALEVRFGWQTDGSQGWENNYRYPAYGVGWYSGFIGNSDILGNPNAVYGFLSFPVSRLKRNTWISEIALGLTYDLQKYDPETNPLNDAIGAKFAVYVNYSFGGRFQINREMDLLYGLDFTHMSNGRTSQPNFGLNMVGTNLGIRYHFNKMQRKNAPGPRPSVIYDVRPDYSKGKDADLRRRTNNFLVIPMFGFSQNSMDKGTNLRYFNSSLVGEYQHFFHLKHAFVGGLDFFYDGSLQGYEEDPLMLGYHAGYDYRMRSVSIRLQLGGYIYAPDRKGAFFMRPAVKYEFGKHWFCQLGLKTRNGAAADWIELGVGIKL